MKKICPHCKKEIEYDKHQQFGAHITNCKENPKRKIISNKIKETRKRNLYKKYIFKCLYCDKEYELELTKKQLNKGKYKKCCSKTCSSKYSHSFMKETKECKCVVCGNITNVKINTSNKNCKCEKCKINYSDNYSVRINKIKNGKIKQFRIENEKIICNICNQEECSDICKIWKHGREKTFIKIDFDENKIGTDDFTNEYYRIVKLLETEYKNMSLVEIGEKYNINYQTIYELFKSLGIKRRTLSESVRLAIKNGRQTFPDVMVYPYKSGYHESWENKRF